MKKLKFIISSLLCISALAIEAQESTATETVAKATEIASTEIAATKTPSSANANMWKTLAKITFKKEYDELLGFKIDKPVFSEPIQELEGKEITISGYIVPVEGYKSHKEFILSAFPYNMCFFCGGAGPETVMEVYANEPIKFSAESVTIKGVLELNADDINRLMFGLKDAVMVK